MLLLAQSDAKKVVLVNDGASLPDSDAMMVSLLNAGACFGS